MKFDNPMDPREIESSELDDLFLRYREAMPDPEPGANFMPGIWARIDEQQRSTNWFGKVAKALVTAAVAAYMVVAMISASATKKLENGAYASGTYVDALVADNVATLEPYHLDRISHLELGH